MLEYTAMQLEALDERFDRVAEIWELPQSELHPVQLIDNPTDLSGLTIPQAYVMVTEAAKLIKKEWLSYGSRKNVIVDYKITTLVSNIETHQHADQWLMYLQSYLTDEGITWGDIPERLKLIWG